MNRRSCSGRASFRGVLLVGGLMVLWGIMGSNWNIRAGQTEGAPQATAGEDPVEAVIREVEKRCVEERIPMIGREKAIRLAELVRQHKPKLIVECGTAIGYSALWMARELSRLGEGKLITIEIDPERANDAAEYIRRAGLEKFVEVRIGDARELVKEIKEPVDFLFIDCGYQNYYPCLMGIRDRLKPGAVVVADNVAIGERGMRDYLQYVRQHFKSTTEWFDIDLPWVKRDAMEVSIVPGPEK